MKRIIVGIALLTAGLSGCASYAWYKPDATPEAMARDQSECSHEARMLAWESELWRGPYWADDFDRPSASRRWFPGPDPGWRMEAEQRIADRCMEVRGYRLVKQPRE